MAISDEWSDFVLNLIIQNTLSKVELVKGGETRHSSIKKCVDAIAAESELGSTVDLKTEDSAIVIVHDAVRPFVDEETYHSVATAALNHQVYFSSIPAKPKVLYQESKDSPKTCIFHEQIP